MQRTASIRFLRALAAVVVCTFALSMTACDSTPRSKYERGVNVYTLEMNRGSDLPMTEWGEPQSTYDYLADQGLTIIRLAFSWEMLQPAGADRDPDSLLADLTRPVDDEAIDVLRAEVAKAGDAGMKVVLDLHNGCSYPDGPTANPDDSLFCGKGLSIDAQVGIWLTLSDAFRDDTTVQAYDLFNEPRVKYVTFADYRKYSQAVVDAIRDNDDRHVLWVNAMIGGWSFADSAKGGPWIRSPDGSIDKSIVYSQHFYPGGVARRNEPYTTPSDYDSFLASIQSFGEWCSDGGVRCSIGEIGWPSEKSQEGFGGDHGAWNALGDEAYDLADIYEMDVTYFAALGSDTGYLLAYESTRPAFPVEQGIDSKLSQATVIESHLP